MNSSLIYLVLLCGFFFSFAAPSSGAEPPWPGRPANAKWWDARWQYRIPIDLPVSHFDRDSFTVEAALNFQQILKAAGVRGKFDPASLRAIEYDNRGNILGQLPVVCRSEFNPVRGKEEAYLAWLISAKAKEKKHYYIYFDTAGKSLPPPEAGSLPPENLVKNSDFEEGTPEGLPRDFQLSDPAHFALERYEHSKSKKSLKIFISPENLEDGVTSFTLSQEIDVKSFQGQPILFTCDLFLAQGEPGLPISYQLRQFAEDGTEILERAVEPRWLTIELAPGQLVQFYERGRISHQAQTILLELTVRATLYDIDTGEAIPGPGNCFALFLDNLTIRPGERLAIPYANKRCYAAGAIRSAPANKGLEFTGSRRLVFNGRSQGTLTSHKYNPDPRSIHWGIRQGTLEFFFKPYWEMNDGVEHCFVDSKFYNGQRQFRLSKLADSEKISLQIADSEKKLHILTAPAPLKKDTWHYIATTWDFDKAQLQIFLDGKCIGRSGPESKPWPSNPDGVKPDKVEGHGAVEPTMPLQLVVGNSKGGGRSAEGVMDELRISDTVRYQEDFETEEPAEFGLDDASRALFHFEEETCGIHAGDDQYIKSFLFYEEPPYEDYITLETHTGSGTRAKNLVISPRPNDALFEKNFAENALKVYRERRIYPDERKISYQRQERKAIIRPGEEALVIDVSGDYPPLTRSLIIEPAGEGSSLLSPRIIPQGGLDPSSFLSLGETFPMAHLKDKDKALKVAEIALAMTNYYDNKAYETAGGRERGIGYSFMKHLNLYPLHQCGPLNYFLRKLFLTFGLSSNQFSGTGHSFEQVFYDGQWHVFDLSARKYFVARDYQTPMSLSTIEQDPYMMEKNKKDAFSFLPARMSGRGYSRRLKYHSMDFALRPGERLVFHFYNEGRWLDTGPKKSTLPITAMPPHYANGRLSFKPDFSSEDSLRALEIEGKANLSKDGGVSPAAGHEPLYLIYKLRWPYILVGGRLSAKMRRTNEADTCAISLSLDEGKIWERLWQGEKIGVEQVSLDFSSAVKAKYDYWLRFELKAANQPTDVALSGLEIISEFYHAPLTLPGRLKAGRNTLRFKSNSGDAPAKVTYQWVERARRDLEVVLNSISFYTMEEESNLNLFVAEPETAFPVVLDIRGGKGKGKVGLEGLLAGWKVEPETSEVSLANSQAKFEVAVPADEETPGVRWFDIVLKTDEGERRIRCQVFLTAAVLALEAEAAKEVGQGNEISEGAGASGREYIKINGPGGARYEFETKRDGECALWVRARFPDGTSDSLNVVIDDGEKRTLDRKGGKIFVHYGEKYGFWQWYRVGPFKITPGKHNLVISPREPGGELDALLLIPDDQKTRQLATHILQNWLFMPWGTQ